MESKFNSEWTSSEQFLLKHFGDWVPCGSFSEEYMPLEPHFNYFFSSEDAKSQVFLGDECMTVKKIMCLCVLHCRFYLIISPGIM